LQALATHAERAQFEGTLLERYASRYPQGADGTVLFPFRRLFLWGTSRIDGPERLCYHRPSVSDCALTCGPP